MVGLFKQKSPGNVVILLIFGLLIKTPLFLFPHPVASSVNDGWMYRALIHALPANAIMFSFLAFALLYIQCMLVNYLVNEYRMLPRQNYLPAMAYLLISSLLPEWNYFSAPLVTNTLLLWMLIRLFSLYNSPQAKPQVYNIGLLAGIGSFFYFPSALFIVCLLIGLMILKPFRLNEIILFLLGCTTPYYFYGIYLFIFGNFTFPALIPVITVTVPAIKSTIWLALSTLLITIPFLVGGYFVQTHLRKMLIQVRKNWSIVLIYLLLSFFVPFINSDQSFHTWALIIIPFSSFHACAYFYPSKGWLPLALFLLTTGFILVEQYATPLWH